MQKLEGKARIALDAMGSDIGPEVVVQGALMAARDLGDQIAIALVGDERGIREHLSGEMPLSVVHASEQVRMEEKAREAFRRKRDSSIAVCTDLVRRGEADALVSTGHTGVVVTTALLGLGRVPGIKRPAIATLYPTTRGDCVLLDVGATADCKPMHLYQFAWMGRHYAKHMLGIEKPRVGLLSIGEEPGKGNQLTIEAHRLMAAKRDALGFCGNLEGKDIFEGGADVVVCDGFTGNVILKMTESIVSVSRQIVKQELRRSLLALVGAMLMKPALGNLKRSLNYEEYGGALLLGVRGITVIGHGRSSPQAVCNAVKVAARAVQSGLMASIDGIAEETPPAHLVANATIPDA